MLQEERSLHMEAIGWVSMGQVFGEKADFYAGAELTTGRRIRHRYSGGCT